jgi:hypothetical protein
VDTTVQSPNNTKDKPYVMDFSFLPGLDPPVAYPPLAPPAPLAVPVQFRPGAGRGHAEVSAHKPWASEIVDGLLWLGSGRAAEQLDELERRGM